MKVKTLKFESENLKVKTLKLKLESNNLNDQSEKRICYLKKLFELSKIFSSHQNDLLALKKKLV